MTADLRSQLIDRMQAVFGSDQRRIDHALRALGSAEQILADQDADATVVVAAAILHDTASTLAKPAAAPACPSPPAKPTWPSQSSNTRARSLAGRRASDYNRGVNWETCYVGKCGKT